MCNGCTNLNNKVCSPHWKTTVQVAHVSKLHLFPSHSATPRGRTCATHGTTKVVDEFPAPSLISAFVDNHCLVYPINRPSGQGVKIAPVRFTFRHAQRARTCETHRGMERHRAIEAQGHIGVDMQLLLFVHTRVTVYGNGRGRGTEVQGHRDTWEESGAGLQRHKGTEA